MTAAALILAAGRSSRMGRDKALLPYRGRDFLSHLVYLALPRVSRVVAVLGHHAEKVSRSLPDTPRVEAVINSDYDRGMLSSLQAGLARIPADADWVLWMLVDHPAVRGRTLDTLLRTARDTHAPLVIPRCNGRRGHPIMVSKRVANAISDLPSEASPQDVVRAHYAQTAFVDVEDDGVLRDVDIPEEFQALEFTARE